MKHNSKADCWTTINGGVYNVSAWIAKHPGGAEAIIGLCGIDGSDAFNGQHGGERRPATELAGFKIGDLAK
jgi:cytochrome b involved in lipid metabolism